MVYILFVSAQPLPTNIYKYPVTPFQFSNHDRGCVDLLVAMGNLFIISLVNIIYKMQTSTHTVEYLAIYFAKGLVKE